jgi:hypothetical protein
MERRQKIYCFAGDTDQDADLDQDTHLDQDTYPCADCCADFGCGSDQ